MVSAKTWLSAAYQTVRSLSVLAAYWFLRQPRPRYNGTAKVKGLTAPAEIVWDRWGVPHIYAKNAPDLVFAQGYVHAQERLWQMDFNRRLVAGRLSEVLGGATVPVDRWMRTLTLRRVAESEAALLNGESRELLEAYTAGVNACIEREPLPLEFRLLDFKPEPWAPADSLAWPKMMCWNLCVNWETEILRARLIARLGAEVAASLEPDVPQEWVRVVPPGVDYSCIGSSALQHAAIAQRFTGPNGQDGIGSNNWVLSGRRTTTRMPILANDMHLGMTAPAVWYENHLSGGDLHVTGVSFPGVPLVVAGHNEQLAWGYTNGFPDVQDLYMERLRRTPEGRTEYEFQNQWFEAQVIREEIQVKGSQPVVEEVVVTRHGPIINSLVEGEEAESPLAMRWTALDNTQTVGTLLQMNRAASCEAFREALRSWTVPTQNVVYADRQGHIGYSFPGHIPIRAKGNGAVPVPGWSGEYEWLGYVPYEELPHMFDPASGYIASANNRVVDSGYPYWVSPDFCVSGRASRIVQKIKERDTFSMDDVAAMQMEQVSIVARKIMHSLQDVHARDQGLEEVLRLFRDWDGHISATGPHSAIYEVFTHQLILNITTPRLGDLAVRYAGKGPNPVLAWGTMFTEHAREWLMMTLSDPESPWWEADDGRTRADLICEAMSETVAILKKSCGPAIGDWAWGTIHTLTLGHPLGAVKPLDRIFNRGPYAIGGDGDTIWATGSSRFDLGEREIIGPPSRFIADLSDWNNSKGILVPGQSGHPASPHYDDNIAGHFNGEYHPMLFDRERVLSETASRLVLGPR